MIYFGMIFPFKNLLLLLFYPFLTLLLSQECDSGFVWLEDVPVGCGGEHNCFYEADLDVLQQLINNSSETINMSLDDNEDGIMEPVELGYSEWVNGRLVALDCYLSDVMDCNLSGYLPDNIGDLEYLEALWLNGNELTGEIPESIGNLANLQQLYLSDNHFAGNIPDSFCNLNIDFYGSNNWGVEYFNIWGNEICPPLPECLNSEIIGAQNCANFSGDVNIDGSQNILDIVIIVNIILGISEYVDEADVNQDDDVNILDIITLTTMILE